MWTYVIIGVVAGIVVLLCFALAIATFSFENFDEKLKELRQQRNSTGASTLNYVEAINKRYFGSKLQVVECPEYEDHFSVGTIALSSQTMYSDSLASFATVSHELGHARQDATGLTLRKLWRLKRTGRTCGLFFMPLMLAGAALLLLWVFNILPEFLYLCLGAGCLAGGLLIFFFAIVVKYKEIKIEREASDFAMEYLEAVLTPKEVKLCKEFLDSARLTYWGGLIRTMLSWTMLTRNEKMFK